MPRLKTNRLGMDETLNEVKSEGVLEFSGNHGWPHLLKVAISVTFAGGAMMLRPACLMAINAVGRALVN